MGPEREQQVDELYRAALELPARERAAFLSEACKGDKALQRQIESLLEQSTLLLEHPLREFLDSKTGARLGAYKIEAKIGEGGMGEVYRALDTRLNRPVAIKFLTAEVADDSARRRFEQEARIASSLNHPHIVTVYEAVGSAECQYLITEFVDGGTLRSWAKAEKHTWRQIIELLTGVSDGLACAHDAGILHRDIKPENILVSRSGYAKLGDFGLAKLAEGVPGQLTDAMRTLWTKPGIVVGTIAYMSPEQASGERVDERSDIFSFGVVLYELLAGHRPFQGASNLEVLQKIIHQDAPPLDGDIPGPLKTAVEKALERDPADRYQSMRELTVDLRRIARKVPANSREPVAMARPQRRAVWDVTAALVFLGMGGVAGWVLQSRGAGSRSDAVVQVQRLTDMVGLEETPAISPDGKTVAFVAVSGSHRQIWVRLLSGGAPLEITKDDIDHYGPRWSPDSSSLIYYTPGKQTSESGTLWEISALGGSKRSLVNALGPGDLSHDGKNLAFFRFHEGAIELAVAARDLSYTRRVTKVQSDNPYGPRWSPDNRRIGFFYKPTGSSFSASLMVTEASGGAPRVVSREFDFQGLTWAPDGAGFIVSSAKGSSMAYPPAFSLWFVPLSGAPRQLTFGETSYEFPDTSLSGMVVASRARANSDVWKFPVTGESRQNAERGLRITHQTGTVQTVTVSPDESEVAFLSDNGGHSNIWVARVADGEMRAITREFDPRVVIAVPHWSPRGDFINFLSNRTSPGPEMTLWTIRPDGSELRDLGIVGVGVCWSSDGRWLYYSDEKKGVWYIYKVGVEGGNPALIRSDNAMSCSVAPDGTMYYSRVLTQATGAWDHEIRAAIPESGPSRLIGWVSGSRVPAGSVNLQVFVSPDGKWVAMPLIDGQTTNLWALSTKGDGWRNLVDFGSRNVMIARRIAWARDGKSMYASVSDVDSDIVMLSGLRWR